MLSSQLVNKQITIEINQPTVVHMGDIDKNITGQQKQKTRKQKHHITLLVYTYIRVMRKFHTLV